MVASGHVVAFLAKIRYRNEYLLSGLIEAEVL